MMLLDRIRRRPHVIDLRDPQTLTFDEAAGLITIDEKVRAEALRARRLDA